MAQREGQTLNSEAADWLARLQREELSAADRAEFDRWMEGDPARAVAFARAEYAWERSERLRAVSATALAPTPAAQRRWWGIAASLALLTLCAALGYSIWQSNVYTTGVGERRMIALEDGSQVNLNTESRVAVDFGERKRIVRLERGEALFKVAHDAQRPFTVEAGGTVVRAVGTAFNVRMRSQVVEVTVTEGVVAVDEDRVAAGSAVLIAGGTVSRVALEKDALRRRVVWPEGAIELKGETLEQAVEEFNRYRKSKLVVADPAIATIRVGGRFGTDEADKFLSAVKTSFAVRVVSSEGTVYLFGPE